METGALVFTAIAVVFTPFAALILWNYVLPLLLRIFSSTVGAVAGFYLLKKTEGRRALIHQLTATLEEESKPVGTTSSDDWDGIVGFFHPFCNAGGGGERVLWAAIRATQERWPKAKIVVYTGDHDVTKEKILGRVKVSQLLKPIFVFPRPPREANQSWVARTPSASTYTRRPSTSSTYPPDIGS